MLPEDEDGAESSGPPPDPSLREWRHPSEIAAAAAAAARTPTPPARSVQPPVHRPSRSPFLAIGGSAFGVLCLVSLAVYLVGTGPSDSELTTVVPELDGSLIEGASISAITARSAALDSGQIDSTAERREVDANETGEEGNAGEAGAGEDGSGEGVPADGGAVHSDEPDQSITTTTVPSPADSPPSSPDLTTAPQPESSTESTVLLDHQPLDDQSHSRSLLVPALLPNRNERVTGVFGIEPDEQRPRLARLGCFVALDGLVYTSASVIGDRTHVALLVDDIWVEAAVIGKDGPTDVAVLVVDDPGQEEFFDAVRSVQIRENDEIDPAPGLRISLLVHDVGSAKTKWGRVTSEDHLATTRSGATVYGAVTTSVARPEGTGGGALYDVESGEVVGLIIDSDGPLATAVPIDRVLDVGRSFVDHGTPSSEWLGLTGLSLPGGGVAISDLWANGPAAAAGLAPDDVVLSIDGTPVESLDHLIHLLRGAGSGADVTIEFNRDGDRQRVEATVGSRPDS